MKKVLVLEDEANIRSFVVINLKRAGYEAIEAATGEEALAQLRRNPDIKVALLDIMLPDDMDGFEVCRRLASGETTAQIPVLLLTARGEEVDRVVGLSLGADDYVVKPFSVRELMLRVRAVLRRRKRPENGPVERHGIRLDPEAHRVISEGKEVALTATEFRLLEDLMRHAGAVRSREQLLDNV